MYIQVTTYKTSHALSRETHRAAEGTMAYVSEKGGELYIRARNGWRKIQVCIVYVWFNVWPFNLIKVDLTLGNRRGIIALNQILCVSLF